MKSARATPAVDRARLLELLEHAREPLTFNAIALALRYEVPDSRLRGILADLVAEGTATTGLFRLPVSNCLGRRAVRSARGYALFVEA